MTSRTDRQKLNRQKQTLPTFISIRWGLWRKSRSKIICFQFSQGFQIFVLNTKFYLMDQHLIWLRRICKHFYVKFEKKIDLSVVIFICFIFFRYYAISLRPLKKLLGLKTDRKWLKVQTYWNVYTSTAMKAVNSQLFLGHLSWFIDVCLYWTHLL